MFKFDWWNEGYRWAVFEGIVPLFGAGILYLVFGVLRKTSAKLSFAWAEAFDPMGWLYGTAILAAQAFSKSIQLHEPLGSTIFCGAVGVVSLLQLLAAMVSRGEDPAWKPPLSLKVVAVLLSLAILYSGYTIYVGIAPVAAVGR